MDMENVPAEIQELYMSQDRNIDDSGVDIYMPYNINIEPRSTVLLNTELRCKMTDTVSDTAESLPYYLYARSSIYKTPLILANGVGVIDRGYRGLLKIALLNTSNNSYTVEKGTRLVQICSRDLSSINICGSVSLSPSETSRGEGGFGSTGV